MVSRAEVAEAEQERALAQASREQATAVRTKVEEWRAQTSRLERALSGMVAAEEHGRLREQAGGLRRDDEALQREMAQVASEATVRSRVHMVDVEVDRLAEDLMHYQSRADGMMFGVQQRMAEYELRQAQAGSGGEDAAEGNGRTGRGRERIYQWRRRGSTHAC